MNNCNFGTSCFSIYVHSPMFHGSCTTVVPHPAQRRHIIHTRTRCVSVANGEAVFGCRALMQRDVCELGAWSVYHSHLASGKLKYRIAIHLTAVCNCGRKEHESKRERERHERVFFLVFECAVRAMWCFVVELNAGPCICDRWWWLVYYGCISGGWGSDAG